MVFFATTWHEATTKGYDWCRAFAHEKFDETLKISCGTLYDDKVCAVFTWEKKEAANG